MATTVWRGYITFGLISIPVRLFRAARSERVKLRQLYRVPSERAAEPPAKPVTQPEPPLRMQRRAAPPIEFENLEPPEVVEAPEVVAPVRRVAALESGGEVLPASSITKGYEYERGQYVTLAPEELNEIAPKTATEMELLEFVELSQVDAIYLETSYYIQPEEPGEKPYALLYAALQKTGLVALGRFAMHRREHLVIVRAGRAGLIGHTMYFSSEVRSDQEHKADTSLVSAKELELAAMLVRNLSGDFEPEKYRDTYREKLEKMIAAKVAGKQVATTPAPSLVRPAPDITEALRLSLAQLKKPASAEKPAAPAASKHRKTKSR